MQNLEVTKKIKVNLTPTQWELYTSSMDCQPAADALNMSFETHFNAGKSRSQVDWVMQGVMTNFSEFGTTDTEPQSVLYDLLDETFGPE